jgi:tripartite-type tricarboxylate transporter receptor subunit TctC
MTHPLTRRTLLAGITAAGIAPVRAQGPVEWPERSITLVHGLAPGGPSDIIARIVAESLSRRFGQQVVVDARPGAGGRLAASQIAKAPPDGYTLMTIPSGHAVSAALYKTLPFRPVDDFAMISMLTEFPFLLVTSADSEVHSLTDLVKLARGRASPLLYGSAGNGSLQHLAGELLSKTLNITFQHVPYRGSAQAITDMMAKRIDFMVDSPTAEMQFIRAGKVRPLMVTSARRFFALPDVPTTAEMGVPNFTFTSWQGLVGPAGMPPMLVDRLATEIAGVLAEPEVIERVRRIGNSPTPTNPNEFRSRILADIEKWTSVVETSRIERI